MALAICLTQAEPAHLLKLDFLIRLIRYQIDIVDDAVFQAKVVLPTMEAVECHCDDLRLILMGESTLNNTWNLLRHKDVVAVEALINLGKESIINEEHMPNNWELDIYSLVCKMDTLGISMFMCLSDDELVFILPLTIVSHQYHCTTMLIWPKVSNFLLKTRQDLICTSFTCELTL